MLKAQSALAPAWLGACLLRPFLIVVLPHESDKWGYFRKLETNRLQLELEAVYKLSSLYVE